MANNLKEKMKNNGIKRIEKELKRNSDEESKSLELRDMIFDD